MNQAVRKGANESWFREVNERLERRAADKASSDGPFEIICECAREECTERISITFREYEAIRARSKTFAVVPGHHDRPYERLVSSTETYDVVEKLGAAGRVAEVGNPRDGEEPEHEPGAD